MIVSFIDFCFSLCWSGRHFFFFVCELCFATYFGPFPFVFFLCVVFLGNFLCIVRFVSVADKGSVFDSRASPLFFVSEAPIIFGRCLPRKGFPRIATERQRIWADASHGWTVWKFWGGRFPFW